MPYYNMMGLFNDPFLVTETVDSFSSRHKKLSCHKIEEMRATGAVTKRHHIRLIHMVSIPRTDCMIRQLMFKDEYKRKKDIYDKEVAYLNSLPFDDPRKNQFPDPVELWSTETPECFF